MINYIIGLKSKEWFYACGGGVDINFLTKNPEEAAKTNDISIAKKLISKLYKKKKKIVDLNGEWDQANDFANTISLDLVIKKSDFTIFTVECVVKEILYKKK